MSSGADNNNNSDVVLDDGDDDDDGVSSLSLSGQVHQPAVRFPKMAKGRFSSLIFIFSMYAKLYSECCN